MPRQWCVIDDHKHLTLYLHIFLSIPVIEHMALGKNSVTELYPQDFFLMFILSRQLNELSRLDLTFLKPAALEFAVFLLSFFYLYICLLVYSYWFIWEVWKEHIYTAMLMRSQMTACRNFGFWGLNSSCEVWKQASNPLGYLGKPQPLQ